MAKPDNQCRTTEEEVITVYYTIIILPRGEQEIAAILKKDRGCVAGQPQRLAVKLA